MNWWSVFIFLWEEILSFMEWYCIPKVLQYYRSELVHMYRSTNWITHKYMTPLWLFIRVSAYRYKSNETRVMRYKMFNKIHTVSSSLQWQDKSCLNTWLIIFDNFVFLCVSNFITLLWKNTTVSQRHINPNFCPGMGRKRLLWNDLTSEPMKFEHRHVNLTSDDVDAVDLRLVVSLVDKVDCESLKFAPDSIPSLLTRDCIAPSGASGKIYKE